MAEGTDVGVVKELTALAKKRPLVAVTFLLIIVGAPLAGVYLAKRPNVNTTQGSNSPNQTGNGNTAIGSNSNNGTQIIAPGASNVAPVNVNQPSLAIRLFTS